MATAIYIYCRFSDGTYGYLGNTDVTAGSSGEEIQTGGTNLAQVSGVSVGQAFVGKTMTHAAASVNTAGANTGAGIWAGLKNPDGSYAVPIQIGGQTFGDLPQLVRPVKMTTGMKAFAAWQASADSATKVAAFFGYATDGYTDLLFADMVDATKTELVNASGATLGQSFSGKTLACYYATYGGLYGLNEAGAGNSALYVEAPDGALKGLVPACNVSGSGAEQTTPYVKIPISIGQNDGIFGMSDT